MEGEAPTETIPDRAQLSAALRELENAKARVERDARQVAEDTKKKLVSQLLPVMDNLDRTIKAAKESGDAPAVIEGITLVKSQLEGVLRGYGVERIEATGAFDPAIHEAVTTIPVLTAEAHNTVVDQLAPGYKFGAQLLRPAQVVVGKLSQTAPEPTPKPALAPSHAAEPEVLDADERDPRPQVDAYGRRVQQPQQPTHLDPYGRPVHRVQPAPPAQVDAYGRPVRPQQVAQVDAYGRPLRPQPVDQYGRPIQFDRYGRPIAQPAPFSPFGRRIR